MATSWTGMMGKPVASADPQVASLALAIGGFGDRREDAGMVLFHRVRRARADAVDDRAGRESPCVRSTAADRPHRRRAAALG
jgi:hypothetical protein